jgi:hypothetical protein
MSTCRGYFNVFAEAAARDWGFNRSSMRCSFAYRPSIRGVNNTVSALAELDRILANPTLSPNN